MKRREGAVRPKINGFSESLDIEVKGLVKRAQRKGKENCSGHYLSVAEAERLS